MRPSPQIAARCLHVCVPFALLVFAPVALAQSTPDAFDHDISPPFRGLPSAQYSGWSSFVAPFGGPNQPDDPTSTLAANVEQVTPGAILTSTMNIYSPGGPLALVIDATTAVPLREAVIQVRNLGSPLDDASFRLTYDVGGTAMALAPTSMQILHPSPGAAEEKLFAFDLSAVSVPVTSFAIHFDAVAAHCSLDALMLDVVTESAIGSTYCSAVPNSTGSIGELSAWGSASIADNDFELRVEALPNNAFGLFVVGQTQGVVPNVGGGAGTLCLSGQIGRFNALIFNSGPTGESTTRIDLTQIATPSGFTAATAGETWNFQCWHRDNDPSPTSNTTLPVSVTFQ